MQLYKKTNHYEKNIIINCPKDILLKLVNILPIISIYNLTRTCKTTHLIYKPYLNDLSNLNVRLMLIIEALILPYNFNVIHELIDYWFGFEKLSNSLNWKYEIDRIANFNLDPYNCTCISINEEKHDNIAQKLLKLKSSAKKPIHLVEHSVNNKNIYDWFHQSKKYYSNQLNNQIFNQQESNNEEETTTITYDVESYYNVNNYYYKSSKCKTFSLRILLCTMYCQMKYILLNDNVAKLIWYERFTHYIPNVYQFNYAVLHKSVNCASYIFENYLLHSINVLNFTTQSIIADYASYKLLQELQSINRNNQDNTVFTNFKFKLIFTLALKNKNHDVIKWILTCLDINFICSCEKDYFIFIRSGYYLKYCNILEKVDFLKFNQLYINNIDFETKTVKFNRKQSLKATLINGFLINGNPYYAWKYMWKHGIEIDENTIVNILRLWNKYVNYKQDLTKKTCVKKIKFKKLKQTEIVLKNWRLYILSYPTAIYKTFKILSFATLFKDFLFIKKILNLEYINFNLNQLENLVFNETNEILNLTNEYFLKKHCQVWTDIKNNLLNNDDKNLKNDNDNNNKEEYYLNNILDQDLKKFDKKNKYVNMYFKNLYNNKYCPSKMLFYYIPSYNVDVKFNPCFTTENYDFYVDHRFFKIINTLVIADENNEKYYNDYDGNIIADYGLVQQIQIDNLLLKFNLIERNLTTYLQQPGIIENTEEFNILQYEKQTITGFACLIMDLNYLKTLINEPYSYPKTFFSYLACMFHTHINNNFMNYLIVEQFPFIKRLFIKIAEYLLKPEWLEWLRLNEYRLNIID